MDPKTFFFESRTAARNVLDPVLLCSSKSLVNSAKSLDIFAGVAWLALFTFFLAITAENNKTMLFCQQHEICRWKFWFSTAPSRGVFEFLVPFFTSWNSTPWTKTTGRNARRPFPAHLHGCPADRDGVFSAVIPFELPRGWFLHFWQPWPCRSTATSYSFHCADLEFCVTFTFPFFTTWRSRLFSLGTSRHPLPLTSSRREPRRPGERSAAPCARPARGYGRRRRPCPSRHDPRRPGERPAAPRSRPARGYGCFRRSRSSRRA